MARQPSKIGVIYDDLRMRICSNELTSHGRLFPERILAEHFQVSNLTIRKALLKLAEEGLIIRVPRVGNFVSQEARDKTTAAQLGILMAFPKEHPYVTEVFWCFEKLCSERGLLPIFKNTNEDPGFERAQVEHLLENGVKRFVISPVAKCDNIPFFQRLADRRFSIIFFDRWLEIKGIPRETIDFHCLAKKMTLNLRRSGCRKVAFFSRRYRDGFLSTEAEQERGFLEVADAALLKYIYQDELRQKERYMEELQPLIRERIDGIVVGSETVLPGLQSALNEHHLKLHRDIKIAFHAVTPRLNEIAAHFGIPEAFGYPLNEPVWEMCCRVIKRLANAPNKKR